MFKSTFMAFMALFLCLSAQAGSYIRTHEDYVHLSDYEKNQLIIKTMELVVALESQYNYEVKKYGYNSERFEKFIQAVSKVKSILFIDSAYAAPTPAKKPMTNWNSYGDAFKKLMNKSGSNCFFAGWPSKPYVLGGKTFCGHPDFIQGDSLTRHTDKPMAEWTQYYPEPKADSGCGANDHKKILCNPAIFGFKNSSKGDLFCVAASEGAHNSAYNCMQEALKERPADSGIDSPAKRLGELRTSLDGNKEAFKAIQDFVYKTCVCDSSPKNFNSNYHAYVRKHRTCYGMMEMMAAVTCGATTPLMDTSIFTSLREYAKDKIIYNAESAAGNTKENMVDHHYEMFIKNEVQVKAKDEYNYICKGIDRPKVVIDPPKDYECSKATCKASVADGKTSYTCSVFAINLKGSSDPVSLDSAPTEVPTAADQKDLVINGKIGGKDVPLTCPIGLEVDPAPVDYICTSATCKTIAPTTEGGKATFECSYVVKNNKDEVATFATAPTEKPAEGAVHADNVKLPITGKIGDQDVSLQCPLTITPAEIVKKDEENKEEAGYECIKAECSAPSAVAATPTLPGLSGGEPETKAPALTCSIEAKEKKDPTKKVNVSAAPLAAPANNSANFKVKIGEQDVELTCAVTMKKADVPGKIEPKPSTLPLGAGGQPQQGPPRTQIRGSSDTSAVGIK